MNYVKQVQRIPELQNLCNRVILLVAFILVGLCSTSMLGVSITNLTNSTALLQTVHSSNGTRQIKTNQNDATEPPVSHTDETNDTLIQFGDLVFPPDKLARIAVVTAWISELNDEQIVEHLDQTTQYSWSVPSQIRREFQSLLTHTLAQRAPNRALTFATARVEPRRGELMSQVFHQWARSDLSSAIDRAKKFFNEDRIRILHAILEANDDSSLDSLREIAEKLGNAEYALTFYLQSMVRGTIENPKKTWYEVIEFVEPSNHEHLTGLKKIATDWINESGFYTIDEIRTTILDDVNRTSVSFDIYLKCLKTRPETTFDYANSLTDTPEIVLNTLISKWANQDYDAVLTKAETLGSSHVKDSLLSHAYESWAKTDPVSLLQRFDQIPRRLRERTSRRAIQVLSRTDPLKAAEIVLNFEDTYMQPEMARTLVQQWTSDDIDAVKNWVLNLPIGEPLEIVLTTTLVDALVLIEPRLAFQIARKLPENFDEDEAVGYEVTILKRIVSQDIPTAIDLLPSVRERSKLRAYINIATELISYGKSDEVFQVAQQLSDEDQTMYYENIWLHWIRHDILGLIDGIEKLPTNEWKSFMATMITNFKSLHKDLSQIKIKSLEKYIHPDEKEALEEIRE